VRPAQIIALVREAGGVPVLAHPIYLKNDALIDEFAAQGLAGLEAYHSSHSPEEIVRYERIADRLRLLRTGGSDYHGSEVKEGLPVGAVKAPYALADGLKRWKAEHSS
jgi:predicted metal-dependent phosphoesterase TrpH